MESNKIKWNGKWEKCNVEVRLDDDWAINCSYRNITTTFLKTKEKIFDVNLKNEYDYSQAAGEVFDWGQKCHSTGHVFSGPEWPREQRLLKAKC